MDGDLEIERWDLDIEFIIMVLYCLFCGNLKNIFFRVLFFEVRIFIDV